MRLLSAVRVLFAATAVFAVAVKDLMGNPAPAVSSIGPRQEGPRDSPEPNRFLRRRGGAGK
jgi:hypothetical protein